MLSSAGLVVVVSSLIVVSGFIQIATNLVNVPAILRRLQLWWYYSDKEENAEINQFQLRLNKQFEFVEFDMAQRYSYYLLQVYTASFYSFLAPIGIFALIGIFFIQYWIDKFNLFTRSSMLNNFNYSLSKNVLTLFEGSILIFAAGNFIFSLMHHGYQVNTANIIGLVIAILYVLLRMVVPSHITNRLFQNY